MFTAAKKGRLAALGVVAIGAAVVLAGCSSSDPLSSGASNSAKSGTIVIGSQAYYSNEIIAEAYAQALENGGYKVDRQYQIGQREVYLPELESGKIDVMPEYSGNLLQYYDKSTKATSASDIEAALATALPKNLRVLKAASATDQDSYNVTKALADKYNLESLSDLKNVSEKLTVGGNTEFQTRPYGPTGLKADYGVTVGFKAIQDSGGPLTVKALVGNQVQLADIYSADPSIKANNLVTLKDPKNLILPQNVIPVVDKKVDSKAEKIIDAVDAKLTSTELIAMNSKSVNDKQSSKVIAKAFLTDQGLLK